MFLKSTLAAGLAAFAIASAAPAAQAEVRINLNIGQGYSSHGYVSDDCAWIGHRYDCDTSPPHFVFQDRGWHDDFPVRIHRNHHRRHVVIDKVSCGEARWQLREVGFRKIKARDCEGKNYSFSARKHGKRYIVKFNSYTGRISASRV